MKLFIDTWGWLALEDRLEESHETATRCYRTASVRPGQILTSNFVLDETITRLFRCRPFQEAVRFAGSLLASPSIRIESVTDSRFQQAFQMRQRFADKPRISFTDLTTMVIMAELKITQILTADSHFTQAGLGFEILPRISRV